MSQNKMPLNFASSEERQKWIVDNAEYFTLIYRQDRRNVREEAKTLAEAESFAKTLASQTKKDILIYAVTTGGYSTWVKNVKAPTTGATGDGTCRNP